MSAAAAAGAVVAGKAVGAVGGFLSRRARAKLLKRDAHNQMLAGEAEAADRLREGRAAIAQATTIAAASGFTTEGSATDVIAGLARRVDTDSRRARFEASLRVQRLKNEARQEKRAAIFGLASGLLSAGASAVAPSGSPQQAAGEG